MFKDVEVRRVDRFIVDWVAPISLMTVFEQFVQSWWAKGITAFVVMGAFLFLRAFVGSMLDDRQGPFWAQVTEHGKKTTFHSAKEFEEWRRNRK